MKVRYRAAPETLHSTTVSRNHRSGRGDLSFLALSKHSILVYDRKVWIGQGKAIQCIRGQV